MHLKHLSHVSQASVGYTLLYANRCQEQAASPVQPLSEVAITPAFAATRVVRIVLNVCHAQLGIQTLVIYMIAHA